MMGREIVVLLLSGRRAAAPADAFTDDFNRANENLEASANWTRSGGSAGDATVASNAVRAITTNATGTAFLCPDTEAADHYVQAAWLTSAAAGPFLCGRFTDASNFVGARWQSGNARFEIYKRVTGTFTLLGTYTAALVSGDIIRLECDGDTARLLVNGVERIAPVSLAGSHAGVTRAGVVVRSVPINPWIDNFEAGAL